MFKKIEIWVLYLIILFSFVFAVGFGVLVRQELVGSIKAGWVSKTALTLAEIPLNIKLIIGNNGLAVEDRFPTLDGFEGTPNTEESYLLLSRRDSDLREGLVELVDLTNFEVLHTWNPDIDAFNDLIEHVEEFKFLNRDNNNSRSILNHPKLMHDGGLLFANSSPLRKIDACSNLIFQNARDRFHHSIETDIDRNIWTSSYLYPQSLPIRKVGRGHEYQGGYSDDAIVKLSPDGKVIFEKSISQIFIENGLEHLLFSSGGRDFQRDPVHVNDIQPVNIDGEYWKKGDVFLSLRHQSMIMLYRPLSNEIIWKDTKLSFHQHDVDILDDHRISIFNNNSKDFVVGNVVDGNNEVMIYDFKTGEHSSYLKDSLVKNDVRTVTAGRSQILPNGSLFIEENNYARTLYFNADGSLRWSHVNRSENGNVSLIGWSRILYTQEDIKTVNNFLSNKGVCN